MLTDTKKELELRNILTSTKKPQASFLSNSGAEESSADNNKAEDAKSYHGDEFPYNMEGESLW
jgi:hypothetical protein